MKRFTGDFLTYPATTREYQLGYRCWQIGQGEDKCPYPKGMTARKLWYSGWIEARTEERLQQMFWNVFFGDKQKEAAK